MNQANLSGFLCRWKTVCLALLAGAAAALLSRPSAAALLRALLRPLTLLGEILRAWSLSGAFGNAGAWAVVLLISTIPLTAKLLLRRKAPRLRPADGLLLAASIGIFACLYLLINPSLIADGRLAAIEQSLSISAAPLLPALTLLSILTACLLGWLTDRWDKTVSSHSLLRAMRILLHCIMALKACSMGYALTQSIQSIPISAQPVYTPAPLFYESSAAGEAWAQLLLTCISCTGSAFLLCVLQRASLLCTAFSQHGFRCETEAAACLLAQWGKRSLIACVSCAAGQNIAVLLCSGVLSDLSAALTLPLSEIAFSCGAMLLARCIASACRIQHENDLMI